LDLPADAATAFGADPEVFVIAQAAVALAGRQGDPLRPAVGTPLDDALGRLGVELGTIASVVQEAASPSVLTAPDATAADNPYAVPWLRDLLELAVGYADHRGATLVPRLEAEVDRLHRLLLEQKAGEAQRLRADKLSALAEFAAGAGHEINNPLAVISGQAQYLLGQEADPSRQKALQVVIQQA
jgi:signal transduction histidine kinase